VYGKRDVSLEDTKEGLLLEHSFKAKGLFV
jgi:hypothetical protein